MAKGKAMMDGNCEDDDDGDCDGNCDDEDDDGD